jgi:eukaryotic-like serine/threonine-protein kinase
MPASGRPSYPHGRMNTCARFETLLALRADAAINGGEARVLEEHLQQCAGCRAVAETMGPTAESASDDRSSLPEVPSSAYVLGTEIARGGMGRIVAARDVRIGRTVAVKELLESSPHRSARFEREARMTARLQHPGIIPIYEIGRWPDGKPFYSMRQVPGRTLHQVVMEARTLADRLSLLPSVTAATAAVAYAHSKQIIHRDLSPTNILVGAHGETVVIDWGLAKDLSRPGQADIELGVYRGSSGSPDLTAVGTVIGTPAYMPPEQALAGAVDLRADVYALGAILYLVVTGRPPYRGADGRAVLERLVAGPPTAADEAEPGVPRDLASIIQKAMAREPADRYPSARELADELARFQAGRLVQAHEYSPGEIVHRWIRRNRAVVVSALLALLVILGGGAWSAMRIVAERNRAEEQREAARRTTALLLEDQGRQELLAGNSFRALAYFAEAYRQGIASPSLRFLLATAMRDTEQAEHTLARPRSVVTRLAFSADGRLLLVVAEKTIETWRVKEGTRILEIRSTDGFGDAELSSDGTRILSRDRGGNQAKLWDAATGALRCELKGHLARLVSASFTGDARSVVTTSEDRTWRVWDAATCESRRIVGAKDSVFRAALSADGRHLATWNHMGKGSVWDISSSALVSTHDFEGIMPGASFTLDGKSLATCGADFKTRLGIVKLWEVETGRMRMSLPAETGEGLYSCEFDDEGARLLTSSAEGIARVWDAVRGGPLATMRHGTQLRDAHFSPDGRQVVTTGLDSASKVWDAHSGILLGSYVGSRGMAFSFSPDGSHMAMADDRGAVTIRRAGSGRLRRLFDKPAEDRWRALGRDGERVVTYRADGTLRLWDAVTGKQLPHAAIHSPVAFSRDGRRLAAAAGRDRVLMLDADSGSTLLSMPRTDSAVKHLELNRDGSRMLIVSEGEAPRVWDSLAGKLLLSIDEMTTAGSIDDAGRYVLAWNTEQRAHVWDVETGQVRSTLEVLEADRGWGLWESLRGRFLHDGSYVYLNENRRHRVTVFETATGRRLITDPNATSISVDRSKHTFATFGMDGVARLWSAADGSSVGKIAIGSTMDPISGALSPDGFFLVVVGARDSSVWSALDGRLLARFPMRRNLFQWRHRLFFRDIGLEDPTRDALEELQLPMFARDGASILTLESQYRAGRYEFAADPFLMYDSVAEWEAGLENRSATEISAIVARNSRWRLVGSRLVPILSNLRGRVVRGGRPAAQTLVRVVDANTGDSRAARYEEFTTIAGHDGRFVLQDLDPGPYDVRAYTQDGRSSHAARVWLDPDKTVDLDVDLLDARP